MKSILNKISRIHSKFIIYKSHLRVLQPDVKQATFSEIASLTRESASYKHAYETTMVDRDRIASEITELTKELATYKHAYETTLADRDRLALELKEITDPLDAGYFRVDFKSIQFFGSQSTIDIDDFTNKSISLFESGEFFTLVNFMLANLPPRFAHHTSHDYFYPFAVYYMACFFAARRRHDLAAQFTKLIEFDSPPDATDFLPYDIRVATRLLLYRQERAINQGKPSIVIFGLTKSASAFFHPRNNIAGPTGF